MTGLGVFKEEKRKPILQEAKFEMSYIHSHKLCSAPEPQLAVRPGRSGILSCLP
jgi:hypothetical protein